MRIHKSFRTNLWGSLLLGTFFLMLGLLGLLYLAYFHRNTFTMVFILACSLPGVVAGISEIVGTPLFYALLTRLVEEKISAEDMTITIRIEEFFVEGIGTRIEKADLRFLGENSDLSPAITLERFISQSSTKYITPGTQVKVFGAREREGPVVIETEKEFLWPICRGETTRREVPTNLVIPEA
jgi:hypothetical protein